MFSRSVWCGSRKAQSTFYFCILFLNPSDGLLTTLIFFLQGVNGTMPVPSWSVTKSLQLLAARKLVLVSSSWQPEVSEINLITMIHFHWIFAANSSSLCVSGGSGGGSVCNFCPLSSQLVFISCGWCLFY